MCKNNGAKRYGEQLSPESVEFTRFGQQTRQIKPTKNADSLGIDLSQTLRNAWVIVNNVSVDYLGPPLRVASAAFYLPTYSLIWKPITLLWKYILVLNVNSLYYIIHNTYKRQIYIHIIAPFRNLFVFYLIIIYIVTYYYIRYVKMMMQIEDLYNELKYYFLYRLA